MVVIRLPVRPTSFRVSCQGVSGITVVNMVRPLTFIFVSLVLATPAQASDDYSINALSKALVALAPDVDPGEAQLLSLTAHTTARRLKKEYRVVLNPEFQNFLINIGMRKRGYCAHYTRDIGARLKELRLKTLVLHWGAAYVGTTGEQLPGSDCAGSAFRRLNHSGWLAQSGPIILVRSQKRSRLRSGTTLRLFRHHPMERGHAGDCLAARLRAA